MLPRAPKKSAAASAQSALANLYTKRAPETILSTLRNFKIFFIVQAFLTVVLGTLTLENVSWWYRGPGSTANNAGFEDLTIGILHFWPLRFLGILVLENVSWWSWGAGSTANTAGFGDLTVGILHLWPLGFAGNSSIICVLMFFFCGLHILLHILSSNACVHLVL